MKALFLVLLVVGAFSIKVEEGLSRSTQRHVDELKKTRWGSTILEMISLHSLSKGPVDELIKAIDDLIADLNSELEELEQNYSLRTDEHNREVITLTQAVQDAVLDVTRTDDTIENFLTPRRTQLKNKIKALEENKNANKKKIDEITLVREQDRAEFESLVKEYNETTDAVDQALNLLGTLSNPSLADVGSHVKNFHLALKQIENKIKPHNSEHSALIKALITLAAEQNFSDQNIIRTIVDKLNEFRVAIINALNDVNLLINQYKKKAGLSEANSVQEFQDRVDQLSAEIALFQREILKTNIDLTATVDKISQLTVYLQQRDTDRKTYQEQLDLENSQYAEESDLFDKLKNENLRELGVIEQALQLIHSADFSGIKI